MNTPPMAPGDADPSTDRARSMSVRQVRSAAPIRPSAEFESEPGEGFARYYRHWLTAAGVPNHFAGREAFARAHPELFGRAYEVTLRGYQQWLARNRASDDLEAFAYYVAGRYDRWLATECRCTAPPPSVSSFARLQT